MPHPATPRLHAAAPPVSCLIYNRWRLKKEQPLGAGSFGEVRIAMDVQTNEEVAVKLERQTDQTYTLPDEYRVYCALHSNIPESGFARTRYYGSYRHYLVLVMDRLGPSVERVRALYRHGAMPLKDVLMIGLQLVTRLEYLHHRDFVHRDVKPENFLLDLTDTHRVYLVDFGLSKRFRCPQEKTCYPDRQSRGFTGTAAYASINAHRRHQPSRRDDLESLVYSLLCLYRGALPWDGVGATEGPLEREIGRMKENMATRELFSGMPAQLETFYSYVRRLGYMERPKYSFLRDLLMDALVGCGHRNDRLFSWV